MMPSWAATAVLLAVPGTYFLVLGRARLAEIDKLQTEARETLAQAPAIEEAGPRPGQVTDEFEQLEAWAGQLRDQLAPTSAATSLLLDTSATLQSFGLDTEQAEILPQPMQESFRTELVKLVVSGAFCDLFRFIDRVESSHPPIRVTSLGVKPNGMSGRVRAEMSLERFWRRDS